MSLSPVVAVSCWRPWHSPPPWRAPPWRRRRRGQVLATGSGSVTVCVGKNDGAEVGQVLNVVRHVRTPSYGKKSGPRFRRQDVGQVTITEVFDEHYASAKVAKGSPRVNDTVELERR
jgi:hypothetical protein